jgi:predicted dehydrogenase
MPPVNERFASVWRQPVTLRLIHIGLGGWGRNWEEVALPRVPAIERVAIVDADPAVLATAQETLHLSDELCFPSLDAALGAVQADAVLATVPLAAHVPVSLAALDAGLHVLVEKPFAPTVAEAQTVVEAADQRGLTLMVSQNYRFFPAARLAQKLVQDQVLGPVGAVHLDFRFYSNQPRTSSRPELFHPLLVDMSIHHYDLIRMVLGQEPVEVYCTDTSPSWSNRGAFSGTVATIKLADDAVVSYRGSWVSTGPRTPWSGEWRMECTDGEIAWTSRNGADLTGERVTIQRIGRKRASKADLPTLPATGRAGALTEFSRAIESGTEPETSGRNNLGTLALMEATVRSAASGRVEPVLRP